MTNSTRHYYQGASLVLVLGVAVITGVCIGAQASPEPLPQTLDERSMTYYICDESYKMHGSEQAGLYEDTCGNLQDITGVIYTPPKEK